MNETEMQPNVGAMPKLLHFRLRQSNILLNMVPLSTIMATP